MSIERDQLLFPARRHRSAIKGFLCSYSWGCGGKSKGYQLGLERLDWRMDLCLLRLYQRKRLGETSDAMGEGLIG